MQRRVLIIDDCQDIHDLVRVGLSGEAIEWSCATDGAAGLARATATHPDLILLDVDLPKPDGFEVCRRLKNDPKLAAIPVIFLTAATSTEEKIRGLQLGAIDYITKPFDVAELRARVGAGLRTKYLMDLLAQRAMIDGLTGLWNRTYFDQRLATEMSLFRRSGRPFGCLMIDVDHFKAINDQHGHPGGDKALQEIGRTISAVCRTEDITCRIGGEEFAVLAPNTDEAQAVCLAERLRKGIAAQTVEYHDAKIKITCSIGVAGSGVASDVDGIVAAADRSLYRAKETGRNMVVGSDGAAAAVR